jgi:2,3-dihydroxybenzoate-AMP ligase
MPLEGFPERNSADAARYVSNGSWANITLGDLLDRAAARRPEGEAVVDGRTRLTYAEFRDRVDRLAQGMVGLGIGHGDCVLLQLPNWAEFALSYFALARIGATAVLLLTRHRQLEINFFCGLTGAKAWIVPERHRNADFTPIIEDVTRANPTLKHVITVRAKDGTRFTSFEGLLGQTEPSGASQTSVLVSPDRESSSSRPSPGDVAFVIPTGGSTGLPKAVPRTHNDSICEATYKAVARGQTAADICLFCVPLEHNLGLAAFNGIISQEGKVVMLDSTRAEDICSAIQREKVTCAPLVPTLLARLAGFDGLARYDLGSLKAFYVGGSRTPPDVIRLTHERIGRVYMGAFGMSEGASCSTRLDDTDDVIINSIGRPCCPFDEFKPVGPEGEDLPRNAAGELLVQGPGIFSGYLQNPAENKRAFTQDGYFRTGDLARIDDSGNVRITGRIKDIIIRGGENISPIEMETMIREHPDVADVAVVGMPDPDLGERACAYIQARAGANLTLEDVTSFLRDRGASVLQLPERVEVVRHIPLTKVGKPDKKALREDIKKKRGQ